MSETPTPETDSVTRSADETPWTPWVCAGHAKRLERERDEARMECNEAQDGLNKALDERNQARMERDEAISKLKFAQNELFTILRFQEDEKREHRNLLERLSFFQNRFESMRAERDQAMSDLEELREELKEEAK